MVRRAFVMLILLGLLAVGVRGLAVDKRAAQGRDAGPSWPQWRGPQRDGISSDTGLLSQWPEGGPPLAWRARGMGRGFSSVSIADNRIFSMGDRDDGQYVVALKLSDGSPLWSVRIGDSWDPGGYSGPRCTPTVDGKYVYALSTGGDLVCLTAGAGRIVWHRSLPRDFGGRMHSSWGFSESPLVDGNQLVCTPGGPDAGMVALNKKTGNEIWRCAIGNLGANGADGAAYSSMVISTGAGVRQYVQLMGRGVVGVRANDGEFLWGYNRIANRTANIPTPLVRDDYVFCSTGYGSGAALLQLKRAGNGVEANEVYFLDANKLQNHHGGMIMLGDYVYCGHGHKKGAPTCLEWKTGNIAWRKNRGPGADSAAVAYADGNLYFRYQNGVMALIGATPEKYEEHGVFHIPESTQPSWPHPVIAGGKLYLREQDDLFCYDVRKK